LRSAHRTKKQLVDELSGLRGWITKLGTSEVEGNQVDEEASETDRYTRALIDSSLDMIISVDRDRRITEFNRAAQETFGYARDEILGKHVGILYDDQGNGLKIHESIMKTGGFVGEAVNKRKNGKSFKSFLSASVLRDSDNRSIGFMGISRDMTELRRIQERLWESEKMASLGRLVAGVAHELNNPICFIYSNIPHLRQYIQDMRIVLNEYDSMYACLMPQIKNGVSRIEELKEEIDLDYTMKDLDCLVDDIDEGAGRAKRIVEDLKAFSHLNEGKIENIDINKDIDKSLNLITSYHRDRIAIHKDYADLPRVRCYSGQISRVLIGLLTNACQAIEDEGDIWITTTCEEDDKVAVSIRDNGPGIAKQHIDKIFDPFFTTKDVGKGAGLGLSISYGIIQRHRGEIWVDSEPGSGTIFTVQIPVDFEKQRYIG
jgi:PAS domain S-box-containing protein